MGTLAASFFFAYKEITAWPWLLAVGFLFFVISCSVSYSSVQREEEYYDEDVEEELLNGHEN